MRKNSFDNPCFTDDWMPPRVRWEPAPPQPVPLPAWFGLAWVLGTLAGLWTGYAWFWLAGACAALVASGLAVFRKPNNPAPVAAKGIFRTHATLLVAAGLLAAGWAAGRGHYLPADDIAHFAGDRAQLARVEGVIADEPGFTDPDRGAFADFGYRPPATLFVLEVSRVQRSHGWDDATGRLLVRVRMADHRLRQGDQIRAAGWLAGIGGPMNPGDFDHRARLERMGITGRLSVADATGITQLDQQTPAGWLAHMRQTLGDEAGRSLNIGISTNDPELGLLRALLLGRRDSISRDTQLAFKQTGLAHLLAISGAHLAILIGLIWFLARSVSGNPRVTAVVVLFVLGLYLMMVPMSTPITRAAIMAVCLIGGQLLGRKAPGISLLACAAILLLVANPNQAVDAGFQLSFGIVLALILFTRPLSIWFVPLSEAERDPEMEPPLGDRIVRFGCDYAAANLVAFVVATPLVAFHFKLITPYAVGLSFIALPFVAAVLALGYLKILLGLAFPSIGLMLADLLVWCSESLSNLVHRASDWPGSVVVLNSPPPAVWVLLAELVALVILTGGLLYRRKVVFAGVGLCGLWLVMVQPQVQQLPAAAVSNSKVLRAATPRSVLDDLPAARVTMFAVGDGSCMLVQLAGDEDSPPHNLMFDCGSQQYLDLGSTSIAPSLRALGVTRIDTLVLSHADIDHFGGTLDVADELPIGRVLMSPQMMAESERVAHGATRHLVDGLLQRRISIETVAKGWQAELGSADVRMLWPPTDFISQRSANDTSLVLQINTPGGRVLLAGDIQEQAMHVLLDSPDEIRAAVTELPHHGSYHDLSESWLEAVSPEVVIQSCGRARMHHDRWDAYFAQHPSERLVTARSGMVQVSIFPDGRIHQDRFLLRAPPDDGGPDE